jgi:hypothetical protein
MRAWSAATFRMEFLKFQKIELPRAPYPIVTAVQFIRKSGKTSRDRERWRLQKLRIDSQSFMEIVSPA